jgi:hypothetical protein
VISLGIDPGRNGALAIVNSDDPDWTLCIDMPDLKSDLIWPSDPGQLLDRFNRRLEMVAAYAPFDAVVIEQIWAGGQASKGSLATFLGEYWLLRYLLCDWLHDISPGTELTVVQPRAWQKAILGVVPKGKTKAYARDWVRAKWPTIALPSTKAKREGWCDALCIASWGLDNATETTH